jgi:hypothetical protein
MINRLHGVKLLNDCDSFGVCYNFKDVINGSTLTSNYSFNPMSIHDRLHGIKLNDCDSFGVCT